MNLIFASIRRRVVPAVISVFALSIGLSAQSRLVAANSTIPAVVDLNSSLFELTRVAAATDRDLENSHLEGSMLRWVTFWRRDSAHKAQIAEALRRNLQLAVPSLVRDAQASHGSIAATFKLYNDVNVVCESLDSLIASPNSAKYPALSHDLADMNRVRQDLSSHIQRSAALLENANPELVSSAGHIKKIIVDDDVPVKRTPRKKTAQQ